MAGSLCTWDGNAGGGSPRTGPADWKLVCSLTPVPPRVEGLPGTAADLAKQAAGGKGLPPGKRDKTGATGDVGSAD